MLLTSSQVSIALSSFIIFIFTTALFLSGYAIQQRTLRDLRAAIKPSPRPEPKIFLPDRFKHSTTELPDGTIIEVDDGDYYRGRRQKRLRPSQQQQTQQQQQGQGQGRSGFVVEVKPTLPQGGKSSEKESEAAVVDGKTPTAATGSTGDKGGKGGGQTELKREAPRPPRDYVQHPDDPEKVVSRAERRRLIKENLQKTAQGGERRGYYQRRLW